MELLKHPIANTLIMLIGGSLVALYFTRKWQVTEQKFRLTIDFLRRLNDIAAVVRNRRRTLRLDTAFNQKAILSDITDIESSLRTLLEEAEMLFEYHSAHDDRKIIASTLEVPIKYFRSIAQEIEQTDQNSDMVDSSKTTDENFPIYYTLIARLTHEYKTNVLEPFDKTKQIVWSLLGKH